MEYAVHPLNRQLFLYINAAADAHPAAVRAAVFAAEYLVMAFFAAVLVYLAVYHRRHPAVYGRIALAVLLAVAATYLIRKFGYHPRPFALPLGTNFLEHSNTSSFPSKHLTSVFAVTVAMCWPRATRRMGLCLISFALWMAWARIYLGVHWPFDMLGALVVALVSCAAVYGASRIRQGRITQPA